MQHTHAQELQRLQLEKTRLHRDNLKLHHRMMASHVTLSSPTLRIDCPSFCSEDKSEDMKLALHKFHM